MNDIGGKMKVNSLSINFIENKLQFQTQNGTRV